ncbi:MAG TPA: hypothetical protein VKF14_00185 [Candidatus Dormibacteraeota bacterium]|nr:hypothetical protein [Candidatus Dormibacteraeota bacterium]
MTLQTPRPGFTGGAGQPPSTPTDRLLIDSPRWEAACKAPLIAEVAARLRSPEALLLWVPQHNAMALALSGLAGSALGSAPAEHRTEWFPSDFDWEVVRPFRRAIDRALVNVDDAAWAETQHVFDELTNLLADWQAERLALAGPGAPPGPLRPGQDALHLAKPAIAAVERLLSVRWDFGRPLRDQVPDLPEGTTGVPEARHVMVVLGGAFYTPADAEAEGQPPLDELLAAIAAGVEATAGPPEHHPRWGDLSLTHAPFEDGSEAAVWATPSARIALTSLQYDHHQPALVQAFVVPPGSFTRRLAFQLWRTQRWMRVHR